MSRVLTDVGVGPWAGPWPVEPELSRYDEALLTGGDRRNVVDKYRYWRHEAIVHDLDAQRHDFHVAVENWGHDFNIGSVIRTANAFNAKAFHIVGKRRWNRRGAMVTDRYQHEYHHPSVQDLIDWAAVAPGEGGGPGIPSSASTICPVRCRSRPMTFPGTAFCSAVRRVRDSRRRRGRRRWQSLTSPSSGRRGRSTQARLARSRCTRGCDATSSASRLLPERSERRLRHPTGRDGGSQAAGGACEDQS